MRNACLVISLAIFKGAESLLCNVPSVCGENNEFIKCNDKIRPELLSYHLASLH